MKPNVTPLDGQDTIKFHKSPSFRIVSNTSTFRGNDICSALDRPDTGTIIRSHKALLISGWAYSGGAPLTVKVNLNDTVILEAPCDKPRPDVVTALGLAEQHYNCGFLVEVELATLHSGNLSVCIHDANELCARYDLALGETAQAPTCMMFMHIPKTGGSTVNAVIMSAFGTRACAVHVESDRRWRSTPDTMGELDAKTYISGHIRFLEIKRRVDLRNACLATVLREPIEQLVSHLCWARQLADPDNKRRLATYPEHVREVARQLRETDLASTTTLARLVRSMSPAMLAFFDNCQTRYLSPRLQIERVDDRDARAAIASLGSFNLVGTNDRLPAFLDSVAMQMGIILPTGSSSHRANVARTKYGLDASNPAVREALAPLYRFDEQVYAAARSRGSRST